MHITIDNSVALAILALAWIGRIVGPSAAANIAGWVVGIIVTVLLLAQAVLR
jgi:hypothetical protein